MASSKSTNQKGLSLYDTDFGLRSGLNIKAGKNIKVLENGFEDFDDYFSSSEDEESLNNILKNVENNHSTSPRKSRGKPSNRSIKSMSPFSSAGSDAASLRSLRRAAVDFDSQALSETAQCVKSTTHVQDTTTKSSPIKSGVETRRSSRTHSAEGDKVPTILVTPSEGSDFTDVTTNQAGDAGKALVLLNRAGVEDGSLTACGDMVTLKQLPEPSSALQHFKTRKRLTYSKAADESVASSVGRPSLERTTGSVVKDGSFRVPVGVPRRHTRSSSKTSAVTTEQSQSSATAPGNCPSGQVVKGDYTGQPADDGTDSQTSDGTCSVTTATTKESVTESQITEDVIPDSQATQENGGDSQELSRDIDTECTGAEEAKTVNRTIDKDSKGQKTDSQKSRSVSIKRQTLSSKRKSKEANCEQQEQPQNDNDYNSDPDVSPDSQPEDSEPAESEETRNLRQSRGASRRDSNKQRDSSNKSSVNFERERNDQTTLTSVNRNMASDSNITVSSKVTSVNTSQWQTDNTNTSSGESDKTRTNSSKFSSDHLEKQQGNQTCTKSDIHAEKSEEGITASSQNVKETGRSKSKSTDKSVKETVNSEFSKAHESENVVDSTVNNITTVKAKGNSKSVTESSRTMQRHRVDEAPEVSSTTTASQNNSQASSEHSEGIDDHSESISHDTGKKEDIFPKETVTEESSVSENPELEYSRRLVAELRKSAILEAGVIYSVPLKPPGIIRQEANSRARQMFNSTFLSSSRLVPVSLDSDTDNAAGMSSQEDRPPVNEEEEAQDRNSHISRASVPAKLRPSSVNVSHRSKSTSANNTVGNNTTGNSAVQNGTAGNSTAMNSTGGNDTTRNNTVLNGTTGNSTAWNSTAENDAPTNSSAGNDTTRNSSARNKTAGNDTTRDSTVGNNTTGTNTNIISTAGNETTRDSGAGNDTAKNSSTGNNTARNSSTGTTTSDNNTARNTTGREKMTDKSLASNYSKQQQADLDSHSEQMEHVPSSETEEGEEESLSPQVMTNTSNLRSLSALKSRPQNATHISPPELSIRGVDPYFSQESDQEEDFEVFETLRNPDAARQRFLTESAKAKRPYKRKSKASAETEETAKLTATTSQEGGKSKAPNKRKSKSQSSSDEKNEGNKINKSKANRQGSESDDKTEKKKASKSKSNPQSSSNTAIQETRIGSKSEVTEHEENNVREHSPVKSIRYDFNSDDNIHSEEEQGNKQSKNKTASSHAGKGKRKSSADGKRKSSSTHSGESNTVASVHPDTEQTASYDTVNDQPLTEIRGKSVKKNTTKFKRKSSKSSRNSLESVDTQPSDDDDNRGTKSKSRKLSKKETGKKSQTVHTETNALASDNDVCVPDIGFQPPISVYDPNEYETESTSSKTNTQALERIATAKPTKQGSKQRKEKKQEGKSKQKKRQSPYDNAAELKKAAKKLTSTQIPVTLEFSMTSDEEDDATSSPALSPIAALKTCVTRHGQLLDDTAAPTPPTVTKRSRINTTRRKLLNSYAQKDATYREVERADPRPESEHGTRTSVEASLPDQQDEQEAPSSGTKRKRSLSRSSTEMNVNSRDEGEREADDESNSPTERRVQQPKKKNASYKFFKGTCGRRRRRTKSSSMTSQGETPDSKTPTNTERNNVMASPRSGPVPSAVRRRKSILVNRALTPRTAAQKRKSVTIVQPPPPTPSSLNMEEEHEENEPNYDNFINDEEHPVDGEAPEAETNDAEVEEADASIAVVPLHLQKARRSPSLGQTLGGSTMLPRYSTATPIHYCNRTASQTPAVPSPRQKLAAPEKDLHGVIIRPAGESDEGAAGLRRSKRTRVQRLKQGERIRYRYRRSGMMIDTIIPPIDDRVKRRIPSDENKTDKKKKRKKDKLKLYNLSLHTNAPPEAEDQTAEPHIPVVSMATDEEVMLDCVKSREEFDFVAPDGTAPAETDALLVCKIFKHPDFTLGQLILRPFEEKECQYVRKDTMIFTILYGKVAVTIHRTTCVLETEGVFFVPAGNTYSIKNLRNDEAKIMFTQCKVKNSH